MSDDEKKTYEFVKQFKDINDNILSYLYKYSNSDDILWMTNCLISYSLIENTELGNKLKTLNDYILNENNWFFKWKSNENEMKGLKYEYL